MIRIAFAAVLLLGAVGCDDDQPGQKAPVSPAVTATVQPTPTPTDEETTGPIDEPIPLEDAIAAARQSATDYLDMSNQGFSVAPEDWQVDCSGGEGGGPWRCTVEQGPCSGVLDVLRITLGGQIRGVGEVGCVAT